jgi:hypothetical protein
VLTPRSTEPYWLIILIGSDKYPNKNIPFGQNIQMR